MASQTIRWYSPSGSHRVYLQAVLELVAYARGRQEDFSFGPLYLPALEHQGLAVTGADLSGVRETLDKITGLVQVQEEQ